MTKYEKQIYEIVNKLTGHLTAEQIFFQMKQIAPKIVLATVYNNLNMLYEQGLIRKVSVEGNPDRYDKAVKHDHLVCKKCGALSDKTFSDLTESLSAQLGEPILSYDLKVSYLCPKCRKEEAERK